MAKFSQTAAVWSPLQQIGKSIVFFAWKGIHVMRQYVIPQNPKTPLQVVIRGIIRQILNLWEAMIPAQRKGWNEPSSIKGEKITGMNLCIRENFKRIRMGLPPVKGAPRVSPKPPVFDSFTPGVIGHQGVLSWTNPSLKVPDTISVAGYVTLPGSTVEELELYIVAEDLPAVAGGATVDFPAAGTWRCHLIGVYPAPKKIGSDDSNELTAVIP